MYIRFASFAAFFGDRSELVRMLVAVLPELLVLLSLLLLLLMAGAGSMPSSFGRIRAQCRWRYGRVSGDARHWLRISPPFFTNQSIYPVDIIFESVFA